MSESILTINEISKTYLTAKGNQVNALQNINLSIKANDFICIVGPSGCGKSTLLRIIAGLDQPTNGQVMYKNMQITKPTAHIGMVFQEYSLLPWRTVQDNIALGLEFARLPLTVQKQRASEYLSLVGLSNFAHAYPHELSGGMRQRIAIARALAVEPEILLMDEPFGALDAHTRILLQKELLRIWEAHKKTVLFVTHSVDEAIFLADKIVVMSKQPGLVRNIIEIDIERPRNRSNLRYGHLYTEILEMLENQG